MILVIFPNFILKHRSKSSLNISDISIKTSKLNIELIVDDDNIIERKKFAKFRFIFILQ